MPCPGGQTRQIEFNIEPKKRICGLLFPNTNEYLMEGPGKKRLKKERDFRRLAEAFSIQVTENNRDFYIFCPIKCPL